MNDSIIERIAHDQVLAPLTMCIIQILEKSGNEQQCDRILERVITQLMTPGSIKVHAESFERNLNIKEAGFLYGLIDNKAKYNL